MLLIYNQLLLLVDLKQVRKILHSQISEGPRDSTTTVVASDTVKYFSAVLFGLNAIVANMLNVSNNVRNTC